MLQLPNLKTKIGQPDLESLHSIILRLSDKSFSRQRDLIQTASTMDPPPALRAHLTQHLRHFPRQILSPPANDLSWRTGRITHWSKQIERRMNPKRPPNTRHSRRRAVIERRKHEADSNLIERVLRNQRYRRNVDSQRRQQLGTSCFTTRRTISMFRHRQARSGDDKRSGS